MHQYIDGQWAYNYVNGLANYILFISSLFFFKPKSRAMGLWSKHIINTFFTYNGVFGNLVKVIFVSLESLFLAYALNLSTFMNVSFGELVGTGANYFATLLVAPVFWCVASLILVANPIKQIDVATMFAPIYLIFVKIACFCQGCCWGIEWKYGLYNHHPHHPGTQVPVQAIEAFLALAIFIFLLVYRRKAKMGTMYPMYLILYSATRFPVEFLSAAHEKVVGPFNTYHFLCVIGVVIGILMLLFVKRFGEKINDFFEIPHKKLDAKIVKYEEEKAQNIATETAERLEKAKLARTKAKAGKK